MTVKSKPYEKSKPGSRGFETSRDLEDKTPYRQTNRNTDFYREFLCEKKQGLWYSEYDTSMLTQRHSFGSCVCPCCKLSLLDRSNDKPATVDHGLIYVTLWTAPAIDIVFRIRSVKKLFKIISWNKYTSIKSHVWKIKHLRAQCTVRLSRNVRR